MKCPRRKMYVHIELGRTIEEFLDCLQEECGWWGEASQSCSMEAIPRIIGYVGGELKAIKEKMPHEGQFRL